MFEIEAIVSLLYYLRNGVLIIAALGSDDIIDGNGDCNGKCEEKVIFWVVVCVDFLYHNPIIFLPMYSHK